MRSRRLSLVLSIVIILTISSASAAHAQQTYYLPILQAAEEADLGLAFSNPTVSEVSVILTARTYSGQTISGGGITNPATIRIPASAQRALRAVEIFGEGIVRKTGWIEIRTSDALAKGFFLLFDSQLSFVDGSELQSSAASKLIFPKVSTRSNAVTHISFVHIGSDSLRFAAASLYENSGRLIAREYLDLQPMSGFSGPITDLLPPAGAEGYLIIDTAGVAFSNPRETLIGLETYRSRSDIALLSGVPESALLRTGYLPHLATQDNYVTRLVLVNPSETSQTVTLTAAGLETNGIIRSPSGATVEKTIPGQGRLDETVDKLFGLSGSELISGYIKWETRGSTRGFTGFVEYETTDGLLLSAIPAQGTSFSDLFFSHIAEGLGYYTGVAFLNANTQSSLVSLEAIDSGGRSVAKTTFTLKPGERRSRLLSQIVREIGNQLGGYIRVSATHPIFAFQLFGSAANLDFLANVSAQGVRIEPQLSGRTVRAGSGGTIISRDTPSQIAIPPGALTADTTISINTPSTTLPALPANQRIVAAVDLQPAGTAFRMPVRVVLALASHLDPGSEIPLLILNSSTQQFVDSGFKAVVDESGRNAVAFVTHFTVYALPISGDRLINVTSLSPTSGRYGATVTISGTGFGSNADENIVTFAGPDSTAVTASVVSATPTSLTVIVPNGAVTGSVIVRVGERTSSAVPFSVDVDKPRPALTAITPENMTSGASSVDLRLAGTNFHPTSVARLNGVAVTTTFVDQTLMFATLTEAQLEPGVSRVTVFTPPSAGGESEAKDFTVSFPVPAIASLSATEGFAGENVELKVTGTGFSRRSVVLMDGSPTSTTFVNSTTLNVTLNSSTATTRLLTVSNPSPGGGSSSPVTFLFKEQPIGSLVLVTGNGQSATVGNQLQVTVEARSVSGSLLRNRSVTFTIAAGNGSVSPTSVHFQTPKAAPRPR